MKIKFITLNLWEGGKLMDNIVAFIKAENPDILALQEVYPSTIKVFNVDFPEYKYYFAPAWFDQNKNAERGNAILSKYPLSNSKNIFFDVPYRSLKDEERDGNYSATPRNLAYSQILFENVKINVFNVHGIWDFKGLDNERRLKMSETMVDQIKDKENVILAGDFNCQPNTQTIKNIEKYLKSVFKAELKTTFNMKHKTDRGYATAAVDMIFVSSDIKVLDSYCPDVDVSDHLPLVASLEV